MEVDEKEPEGTIILSTTSEFVRNISLVAETMEDLVEQEEIQDPIPISQESHEIQESKMQIDITPIRSTAIIEEEPLVSRGMAATLKLLMQKNILEIPDQDTIKSTKQQAAKGKWLADQKRRELMLEMEKNKKIQNYRLERQERAQSGKKPLNTQHEKDYVDPRVAAQEDAKRFKDYNPDVSINYYDEYGRALNQKEAFKQLSHRFHGKGSGKNKIDKKLKKIDEELKRNKMTNIDTPLGTTDRMIEKTRELGSAHIVLSHGNKMAAPPILSVPLVKSEAISQSAVEAGTAIYKSRDKVSFGFQKKE